MTPKHQNTETPKHRSPKLPPFAEQWLEQWKGAARELPRVRARELRALGSAEVLVAGEVLDLLAPLPADQTSGLVIQQRWFMRQRLLELEALGHAVRPSASRPERSAR